LLVPTDDDDLGVETFALEKTFFFRDENRRVAKRCGDDADANDIVGLDQLGTNKKPEIARTNPVVCVSSVSSIRYSLQNSPSHHPHSARKE